MLMKRDESALLMIDVQDRLVPSIHDGRHVIENCIWLAEVAGRMSVPTVVTEHFPEKLGATVAELKAATAHAQYVSKQYFSAQADGCLQNTMTMSRRQIVMCGAEAHVCVLQTAVELQRIGKKVFVVADAVGSRDPLNRQLAFERMRNVGIQIVAREMVAFEWLQRGGTDLFREISRDFIR